MDDYFHSCHTGREPVTAERSLAQAFWRAGALARPSRKVTKRPAEAAGHAREARATTLSTLQTNRVENLIDLLEVLEEVVGIFGQKFLGRGVAGGNRDGGGLVRDPAPDVVN